MIEHVRSPWTPKLFWLVIPAFGGATLWWYVVARTLAGQVAFSSADILPLIAFLIYGVFSVGLWLGAVGISATLARSRSVRMLISLLVSFPPLLWFPMHYTTLIALVATAVAVWWGMERLVADQHSRLTVQPHLTLPTFSMTVTIIMAAVALLYYQQVRGTTTSPDQLANKLANQTVGFSERIVPLIYKNYRPDETVDEFLLGQFPTVDEILNQLQISKSGTTSQQIDSQIRNQLSQHDLDPNTFRGVSGTDQSQVRNAINAELAKQQNAFVEEARTRLSDQLGISIQGGEKMHDVFVSLIDLQFNKSVRKYVEVIPWLLTIGVFFVLKVFTGVFVLAVTWIGWAIYRFYRSAHILAIDHEMVPAEKLSWK